mmetsp:Transcript_25953/g.38436  ORF Transcript_25953/g.38436 Transcript_25953/m.38436 type:complete len:238 (-) Transcript_25953:117-830(-)
MRSFKLLALSVFTASTSATDFNGLMRAHLNKRQLAGEATLADITCLMSSFDSVLGSLTSVLGSLEDVSTICPNGLGDCDLSGTDISTQLKAQCTEGKIFEEKLSLCKSTVDELSNAIPDIVTALELESTQEMVDMVTDALDGFTDISIAGIPVCLSSECSDDIDLFPVLASLLDTALGSLDSEEEMDDAEKEVLESVGAIITDILEGKDCSPTTSSSSSIGKFAAVAVALGAALFTL